MVSSGLTQGVSVSQYRLAFHLPLASAIYAAILWTAQQLAPRASSEAVVRLRAGALVIAILLLLQIYLGALVAGLDAGLVFNTWPTIDDAIVPAAQRLWFMSPVWRNLFENTLTVQFDHRMVAYAIWVLAGLHAIDARQARRVLGGAVLLAAAVTLQAVLGVVTLLYQAPLPLALTHQILAIVVFTIAVVHAERLSHRAISHELKPSLRSNVRDQGRCHRRSCRSDHGAWQGQCTRHRICHAIADRFIDLRKSDAKAVVLTGQGKIFRRRRSETIK
jgi:cytochrome c oxidase assembly protein subunit 15